MYNREREIERQERERKEKQWEEELNTAMKGAEERLKYAQNKKTRWDYQLIFLPFFQFPVNFYSSLKINSCKLNNPSFYFPRYLFRNTARDSVSPIPAANPESRNWDPGHRR